jgi:hypothetical protein
MKNNVIPSGLIGINHKSNPVSSHRPRKIANRRIERDLERNRLGIPR